MLVISWQDDNNDKQQQQQQQQEKEEEELHSPDGGQKREGCGAAERGSISNQTAAGPP